MFNIKQLYKIIATFKFKISNIINHINLIKYTSNYFLGGTCYFNIDQILWNEGSVYILSWLLFLESNYKIFD